MADNHLTCPSCNEPDLDLTDYESMMVLNKDTALFTLECPHCAQKISSVCTIPSHLREEVLFAALELGAGMGGEKH